MIMAVSPCSAPTARRWRQRGISLVELMVGLVIGMLVVLAVTGSVAVLNQQRKTTISGGDAQESARTALGVIDRAARLAGAGLFNNGQLLCSSINIYYDGTTLANGAPLLPIKITDGGAGGSDKITVTYADAKGGSGVVNLVDDMPNTSANFVVNHQGSLQVGDLAVVGVPGSNRPCTLFQITAFPPGGGTCGGVTTSCIDVQHNPGSTGKYNPANPNTAFADAPRYGYVNAPPTVIGPAIIARLGKLVQDTYAVMCNSLVSYDATMVGVNAPSCTASPAAFANVIPQVGDVVQIQAQYGISASANSDVVTSWVDATGATWAAPTSADAMRIKAVRIAVVARGREPASGNVTAAVSSGFPDAAAPAIDLSTVTVPAGKTWQNYRYRVYQSVIPLRNVAWNQ